VATAAQLWMLNHALMVIAMMLGAILAMIGARRPGRPLPRPARRPGERGRLGP
jgi:hypothetical protein